MRSDIAPRRKKTAFRVSDGVRLVPTYSAIKMSSDIEILHEANSDILFNKRKISFKRGLNYAIHVQAGLRRCCSHASFRFSRDVAHMLLIHKRATPQENCLWFVPI